MPLSPEGRQRIVDGQKRRWAKYRAETPTCSKGHPWTPENTIPGSTSPSGSRRGRQCRACSNAYSTAYYHAHPEQKKRKR